MKKLGCLKATYGHEVWAHAVVIVRRECCSASCRRLLKRHRKDGIVVSKMYLAWDEGFFLFFNFLEASI